MKYEITKDLPQRFQLAVSVNILLMKADKYLLIRRANTGWADGYYSLPAGHVEGNEPLTAAAVREVKEEAGIDIDPAHLQLVHVMHRSNKEDDQERLDFYFLIKQWKGEPHLGEPEKSDHLGWFAVSELPENTLENVKRALEAYPNQLLNEVNW